jgi:hypothetical protein
MRIEVKCKQVLFLFCFTRKDSFKKICRFPIIIGLNAFFPEFIYV